MSSSFAKQQFVYVHFILKDEKEIKDANEDMQMAYATIRDHIRETLIDWMIESECLRLQSDLLTKDHVFVFEQFSGEAFEYISATNAVLVGPRCLISCFQDNEAIPKGKQPIFTTAMRNLVVCMSGLKPEEKNRLSQMVFRMGGYYWDVLNSSCTHLVSSTVKSIKYEKAAEIKMKIMHPEWIADVWEKSQRDMVKATDSIFDKHALPVFYALTITSTGLNTQKRNQIKQLIEKNGGKYIGAFKSELTDILILEKDSVGSAKFQGAVRCKKECLTPAWIVDSVEKGYALPVSKYEVRSLKSSTPTKDDAGLLSSRDFNPDCSQLSMISHQNSRNLTINESVMSMASMAQATSKLSRPSLAGSTNAGLITGQKQKYRELLEKINLQQVKKAGPFLDGCTIYLSGFTGDEKEKLNRVLNSGGATRYDEISEHITHVIVGEQVSADFREMHERQINPHILTLDWLIRSLDLRAPAQEEDKYIFHPNLKDVVVGQTPELPSPASKKNLEKMSGTFKRPLAPPKFRLDEPPAAEPNKPSRVEDDVLQQYMQKNTSIQLPHTERKQQTSAVSVAPQASVSESQNSELDSQYSEFMSGKTFFVYGFSEEDATQIVTDCENCGGTIVDESYTDVVDYIVLPTNSIGEIDFAIKGKETVNCIWLETSLDDGICHPLQYYFEPIFYGEHDPKPLQGELLVISSYSGAERNFLIALGGILGAEVEDRLVRKASPLVICKEPTGAKYEAALKWDLTVLTGEWLRECLKYKRRVNEESYLVGSSICSSKNITVVPETSGRLSDLPELPKNACLPTTSTDDVDIDSVFISPAPAVTRTESISSAQQPKSTELPNQNIPDSYKHITVQKSKNTNEVEYGFKRLSTSELWKITNEERQVYSQELDLYDDLLQSQRDQRKPFDPGHPVESPLVLKHRRLSTLASTNSPATPIATASPSEYEQLSVTQRVMEFDTPIRDTLYKVLKEAEEKEKNITPRTRRKNELLATPSTGQDGHLKTPTLPECMTKPVTPYGFRPDASPENHLYHKRKLQYWDQFYRPREQKERRKSTPLSEIKRRFWRENLGDEYVNYIESKFAETQFQPFQQQNDDERNKDSEPSNDCQPSTSKSTAWRGKQVLKDIVGDDENENNRSHGSNVSEKRSREEDDDDDDDGGETGNPEPAAKLMKIAESDNLKRLSDLISTNRNAAKKTKKLHEELKEPQYSEIPRFDSEMVSEDAVGVGWREPKDFGDRFNNDDCKDRMTYAGTPVVLISGVNDQQRPDLMEKVQQLGGELSTRPTEYDPSCTHIVCGKPNRGEKILSGIAAGKWLLCTKYLHDSCKAGYFLNEEPYEWGNPQAIDLPPLEPQEKLVAKAAYNWRLKISREAGKHDGVFTGFRVLLLAPKKEQFIRLLQSGGGFVINVDPPFVNSEEAMSATHCFVDKKVKINPRDHKALAEAGIIVMSIMYLNAYLTSETLPDPAKYRMEI
ncbi:DNA topoisomerase 2-binding protein 1-A [Malaya genurostris]|uniref:DNA topoisomerase 2-binding protein 1-A n=1 Tax=Malaya genurostris TaxID=325434 RepID=UPI0026F3DBE1|nr:DNA topoisomerase 2-binding protein 1-A [Malaya genurostris]